MIHNYFLKNVNASKKVLKHGHINLVTNPKMIVENFKE